MQEGRLAAWWEQTAWLAAATYNAQPGRKSPVAPARLNPYYQNQRRKSAGTRDLRAIGVALFGIDCRMADR